MAAARLAARAFVDECRHYGAEVHLVLSVRDLVRQVPAEWQENVKHRAQLSYGDFLDQLRDHFEALLALARRDLRTPQQRRIAAGLPARAPVRSDCG